MKPTEYQGPPKPLNKALSDLEFQSLLSHMLDDLLSRQLVKNSYRHHIRTIKNQSKQTAMERATGMTK